MMGDEVIFVSISEVEAECVENSLIIETSDEQCNCAFFTSYDLPCAHIIAYLKYNGKGVYQPALCNKRWFIENNRFVSELEYTLGREKPSVPGSC